MSREAEEFILGKTEIGIHAPDSWILYFELSKINNCISLTKNSIDHESEHPELIY
jgi:hypothetical protein